MYCIFYINGYKYKLVSNYYYYYYYYYLQFKIRLKHHQELIYLLVYIYSVYYIHITLSYIHTTIPSHIYIFPFI